MGHQLSEKIFRKIKKKISQSRKKARKKERLFSMNFAWLLYVPEETRALMRYGV